MDNLSDHPDIIIHIKTLLEVDTAGYVDVLNALPNVPNQEATRKLIKQRVRHNKKAIKLLDDLL